ncbi:hypothetical protein [Actinomycetospora flava]|uniref:Uncharacterized protein n=1 Tax=Actinomycetospora flava TaxID=3129232 RepID=A0ABU8MDN0_9PSEU
MRQTFQPVLPTKPSSGQGAAAAHATPADGAGRRITGGGLRVPGFGPETGVRTPVSGGLHLPGHPPSQEVGRETTRPGPDVRGGDAGSATARAGAEFRDAAVRSGVLWASVAGVAGAPGSVVRDPDAVRRAAAKAADDFWGTTTGQAAAAKDQLVRQAGATLGSLVPAVNWSGRLAEHASWSVSTDGNTRISGVAVKGGASAWAAWQAGARVDAGLGRGGLNASAGGRVIAGVGAEAHGQASAGPVDLSGRVVVVVGAGADGHASVAIGEKGGEFSAGGMLGAVAGIGVEGSASAGKVGEAHAGLQALAGVAVVFDINVTITQGKVGFSVTAGGSVVVGGTVTVGASFNPQAVGQVVLSEITKLFGGAAGKVGDVLGGAFNTVREAVGGAAGAVRDAVGGAAGAVRDVINGAIDGVERAVGAIGGAARTVIDAVGGAAGAIAGAAGDAITWLAEKIFGSDKPAQGGTQHGDAGGRDTGSGGGQGQGSGTGSGTGSGSGSGSDDDDDGDDDSGGDTDDSGGDDPDPDKDKEKGSSREDDGDGDGAGGSPGGVVRLEGGDAWDRALRILLAAENDPGGNRPGNDGGGGLGDDTGGGREPDLRGWDPSRGGGSDEGDGDGTGSPDPTRFILGPGGRGSGGDDLHDGDGVRPIRDGIVVPGPVGGAGGGDPASSLGAANLRGRLAESLRSQILNFGR